MAAEADNSLTSRDSRVMVTDRGRDFEETRARIGAWLIRKMPEASGLEISSLSHPLGAGISNETILFDARWTAAGLNVEKSFVLRFHPGSYQMFYDPGFERQIRLIQCLHKVRLPVPNIQWEEHDPSVLDNPFFVMDRVRGQIPVSHPVYNLAGWLHDASVSVRRHAWESGMRNLARIHQVNPADLSFLDRPAYPGDAFAQEYEYWNAAYAWSCAGRDVPILDRAFAWLDANRPDQYEIGLAWGDARIGNMIFSDQGDVRVVLDWEQASLAGGLHDLAWWLVMDEMFSSGIGVKRLEGLGTRSETIAFWHHLTGRATDHLRWHEVFACVRGATLVVRQNALNNAPRPGSNRNSNLFTRHLAMMMGWDRPSDRE